MSSHRWRRSWRPPRPEPAPAGLPALGEGRAHRTGVPGKAALLDRAAERGLPVPAGFVITDGAPCPVDGVDWAARVGARTLAVRSAFGAEDRPDASLAGWFTSELHVRPAALGAAVEEVRRSAGRRAGRFRLDVLVMGMVDATHAGVAFSEPGTYDDLVNTTDGVADRLVGGEIAGDRLVLPRTEPAPPGWPRRLQRLLADVRREFGDRAWDVEWADDGTTCWLLQVRPVTAATLRDETLTAANHAEILPPLPSTLMTSVIEEAGPDLFDWYRRRVPGLPTDRDFLHVKHGRPMINLSLLEDMLRHLGLPTRMVADSIGGGHGRDLPARPARMLRQLPSLVRLGLAQVFAVAFARRRRERVARIGTPPARSFTAVIDDLHRAYVALVTGMFPLSSAIGPPLALLRRTGTLLEHAADHRTVTTEMAERLTRLRTVAAAGDERAWNAELEGFLADFGHRGVYESDVARPRYADEPERLATDVGSIRRDVDLDAPTHRRTWRGRVTRPLWLAAARPLAARELLRHDAMRSFAAIRSAAVALARQAVARGQLGSVDDLWLLTADEARRLDTGWAPPADFWDDRRAERAALAELEVPHVIGRLEELPSTSEVDDVGDGPLHGLPLTTGSVTGVARVLSEPDAGLDHGEVEGPVVLVARSIDAGWITTIARADAVIVEIGGDLSHGSILVRELGVPAVTNVAGATRRVRDGDRVRIDAGAGTIHVLEPAASAAGPA